MFLLASCHSGVWHYGSIRNSRPQYSFAKLTYPASHIHDGIELEIVCVGREEIYAYINVKQYHFIPHEGDALQTSLTIQTNHATKNFIIPLLEGRQRARLTGECLAHLLYSLERHLSVTLYSGHFSGTLNAENFKKHYHDLIAQPRRFLPEQLITFALY